MFCIVVPYSQGLWESYKTIYSQYGIQVHFKGGNTLKSLLMFPNDKDIIMTQSNIIYWFKCGKAKCDDEYTGQSTRTFGERYKEYLKAPSLICENQNTNGHTTVDKFQVIGRDGHSMVRAIKEAIHIRVNNLTQNKKILASTVCHTFGTKFCFPSQNLKQINDLSTTTSVLHEVLQQK